MMCFWSSINFLFSIFLFIVVLLLILYSIVDGAENRQTDTVMSHYTEELSNDYLVETFVETHHVSELVMGVVENENNDSLTDIKVYEINGDVFREDVQQDNGTLAEFEIRTTSNDNGEIRVTILEMDANSLSVSIQETPFGIIVNSDVLLPVDHWNTLVDHNGSQKCMVCDAEVEIAGEHVKSDAHKNNLKLCRPLKKFDLAVTRLIGANYHCAVCNVCFDRGLDKEHFDSKEHEEKMLFAINTASDVMYDFDTHVDNRNVDNENTTNDSYHFDRNRILSVANASGFVVNNDNGNRDDDSYNLDSDSIGLLNRTIDEAYNDIRNSGNENRDNDCCNLDRVDTRGNLENTHNDGLEIDSAMSGSNKSDVDSECAEGFYDYDFDTNNNQNKVDATEYTGNDAGEITPMSYASMAAAAATPETLYVMIFGKSVNIKFNHFHMIIPFKSNRLYCMACMKYDILTQKAHHCSDKQHSDKLRCCNFVEDYKDYFMRKIDDKYYHCGLCNSLQLSLYIDDHIESIHKNLKRETVSNVATDPKGHKNNDVNSVGNGLRRYYERRVNEMDQPKAAFNHHKMVVNQSKMNQSQTDLNHPTQMDTYQRKTYQTPPDLNTHTTHTLKDMNQQPTSQPKREADELELDLNTGKENQPKPEKLILSDINDMINADESVDDEYEYSKAEDAEYFNEKFVYLKYKNTYIQVGVCSYNSLVHIGDGTRQCFVCSTRVTGSIKRHIESKSHTNCLEQCKFVSKYDKHLLRQMFLTYHCSICNIVFQRKDIKKHISWLPHLQENKIDKKTRRNHLKSGGSSELNISFQNEAIYLNETEAEPKILLMIEIKTGCQKMDTVQKKNKIVIYGEDVLKISWDVWHSLCKSKSGHHCLLCQSDVKNYELSSHIHGEYHRGSLEAFERRYLPALIRQVNESKSNCVICNTEVSNKHHIIAQHITGKRHKQYYSNILTDSATVKSYTDCNDDVLHL